MEGENGYSSSYEVGFPIGFYGKSAGDISIGYLFIDFDVLLGISIVSILIVSKSIVIRRSRAKI